MDSAGSALSARPEPPLARGLGTATRHSLPRAHPGRPPARRPAQPVGRETREEPAAGDALFSGQVSVGGGGEGRGACKMRWGKGA